MDTKVFNASEYRTRLTTEMFYGEIQKGTIEKLFLPFKQPNEYCDIPAHEFAKQIVDYNPLCSCVTRDEVVIKDDGIEISFNTNNAHAPLPRQAYLAEIRLHFKNPETELYIRNNVGSLVLNPDRTNIVITVFGTIKN